MKITRKKKKKKKDQDRVRIEQGNSILKQKKKEVPPLEKRKKGKKTRVKHCEKGRRERSRLSAEEKKKKLIDK